MEFHALYLLLSIDIKVRQSVHQLWVAFQTLNVLLDYKKRVVNKTMLHGVYSWF